MKKAASRGLLSLNSDVQYDVISQTVERKSLAEIATRFHEPTLADLGKEALEKFEAGRRQTLARLQVAAQESEALSSLHQPTLAELARNIQAEFKVASLEWARDLRGTLECPAPEVFRLERSTLEGFRERLALDLGTLRQIETDGLDPTEAEAIHQAEAAGEAVGTALDRAMATIERLAGTVASSTVELAQERERNRELEGKYRQLEARFNEVIATAATYERKCSRLAEGGCQEWALQWVREHRPAATVIRGALRLNKVVDLRGEGPTFNFSANLLVGVLRKYAPETLPNRKDETLIQQLKMASVKDGGFTFSAGKCSDDVKDMVVKCFLEGTEDMEREPIPENKVLLSKWAA